MSKKNYTTQPSRIYSKYAKLFQHLKLCAYKFDNLEEIDQFFVRHNLLKLTKGEMNNMKRTISIKSLNQ